MGDWKLCYVGEGTRTLGYGTGDSQKDVIKVRYSKVKMLESEASTFNVMLLEFGVHLLKTRVKGV